MKELYLDTTIAKKALVKISVDHKLVAETESESPLLAIKTTLEKADLKLADLDKISANPGPGSYTGVRVGAAVVNSLNFALGKKFELVEPIYQ